MGKVLGTFSEKDARASSLTVVTPRWGNIREIRVIPVLSNLRPSRT